MIFSPKNVVLKRQKPEMLLQSLAVKTVFICACKWTQATATDVGLIGLVGVGG